MPSRNELLAKLMGTMQAPIAKFVQTLNEVPGKFVRTLAAVRDQKEKARGLILTTPFKSLIRSPISWLSPSRKSSTQSGA